MAYNNAMKKIDGHSPVFGERAGVRKAAFLGIGAVLAMLVTGLGLSCAPAPNGAQVLIAGGRLLDGSGNPWLRADVLIEGDRIAAVGRGIDAPGAEVIDATGLYVAPGFIDTHSHAGPGLAREELSHGEPLLAMGVTTIFANPDGGGPIEIAEQRTELLADGLGVNVAQFIGHGSTRGHVLGSEDRAATDAELDEMRRIVRDAMTEGAWGLSSGTFYVPGSYAPPEEIEELAKEVAPFGGAYQSHIRDEASYSVGLLAAVEEVINVGRVADVPAVLTHVKALGPTVWGFGDSIVARVATARAEGVAVFADQYPYAASATSLSAALLPRWSQAGGRDSLLARMDRPEDMARIGEGMVAGLARRGGAERIRLRRYVPDESVEGRLLSELAEERGIDRLDLASDLIRGGSVSIVSHNMNENDVAVLMAQPWTITASDGGLVPLNQGVPHPRSYGAFSRRIARYAIEQGIDGLASAVRSATSLPASVYGMEGRGRLQVGMAADIVVFDLEAMDDPATYTEPHQYSQGMVHVFVNGTAAMRDGEFTGALAGRVLRKGGK